MTEVLDPRYWVEAESGLFLPEPLLAPEQQAAVYPGNDAWLQLEQVNPYPPNSIINPGFEADTSGWTAVAGATITRVTGEKHSGLASLQVFVGTPLDATGTYYQVAAAADQWWHAGVWVKAPAGMTLSLHIWAPHTEGRTNFTGTGAWQFVMADALVGAGDSTILMYVKTNGAVSGTFYVDDAEFCSPPWTQIETTPDSGGIPNKTFALASTSTSPPTISTAQSVFGGSSLFANGLSAIETPDHADWDFGAGDFTVEGRYYITTARKAIFAKRESSTAGHSWEITMDAGSVSAQVISFYYSTTDDTSFQVQVDWSFTATLNVWYHIVVQRTGATLSCYVNGAKLASDYNIGSAVIRKSTSPLTVGGDRRSAGGNDFRGYSDELRISKGIARFSGASFTVPTAPYTRDQYTVLLMHFDGTDGQQVYTDSSGVPPTPFNPGSDPAWVEVER